MYYFYKIPTKYQLHTFCLYFYKIPTKYQTLFYLSVTKRQATETYYHYFIPVHKIQVKDTLCTVVHTLDYWDFTRKITLLVKKLGTMCIWIHIFSFQNYIICSYIYDMEYWKTPKHHITYENTDGSWSSLSLAQDLTFMKSLNSGSKIQGSTHHYMKRSKMYLVKINISKKKQIYRQSKYIY